VAVESIASCAQTTDEQHKANTVNFSVFPIVGSFRVM
jgi:hypothetical protein